MFRRLLALALCALLAPPLSAGDVGDGVRLEILDGGRTERGTYLGAIRLTLPEGWKTYWRAPGDAGIPPQFDWRGSRNIGAMAFTWPAPRVFDQNGLRSVGYERQMVLPVEITPENSERPVRLKGRMDFGYCKDVCVPGTLPFDHVLDAGAGRNPAIAAALAQRPYSASEAGVRAAVCRITPTEGGMRIEAHIEMPSAGGTEYAVIEPGGRSLWVSEAATTRQGGTLIASSEIRHDGGGAFALDRSAIRITVLGDSHAVDIRGCRPG
ncbi:Thiol-disulfide interchange protein, contains DsbC and DsbD domains [Cribrihabitans marinus]|uniref:Thiol-disulfide interchange protein, contains DsbC and DsbD domains n=1 Tax=Cribrihabitans marinus TaxID=1227549 RepID=A0A1H7CL25_9RHOB|nr:protein-disulfide reductase DsbD domain-containing protein [Cribrihabitans marinus]GGH35116.1 hypothetical protein GCM10010973_28230 [Cribrihabitans marinus]SEJ87390.1 Thiol-disulfide interchange protein, contains DsbC and DsbD domains [Cribrihabitans marinus]